MLFVIMLFSMSASIIACGNVYRVGGDEFVALLKGTKEQVKTEDVFKM